MKKNILYIFLLIATVTSISLTSCSKDDDDNGDVLAGTWYGDHSQSYYTDWTFGGNGTGERKVQDGDVGSWYRFKYVITNYDANTRAGHVNITYTSGDWSGEEDNRDFQISESGRGLSLGSAYYTK